MRRIIILVLLVFQPFILLHTAEVNDCPEIDNRRAERLLRQAEDELRSRRYLQANNILRRVLDMEPEYTEAYFMLAIINMERRDYNVRAAKNYLLKVLELCPDFNVYVHYYLADIYMGSQEYELAATHYQKFLEDVDKIRTDEDYLNARSKYEAVKFYADIFSNPVPFNPKPVKGISTPLDEYLAIITPDNQMALFTRRVERQQRTAWAAEDNYMERFMFSMRGPDGEFDSGEPMPYPFNQENNEGGATLTIDNRELFYTVCRFTPTNYLNCDIYTSRFENGRWSEIENLGPNVNLPDAWETQPTITSDGSTLYFVSDRPGGYGGYDLYKTVRDENGIWGKAINLGPTINTPGNERSPFIHTDSQTLYFASGDRVGQDNTIHRGHPGLGGYDIFYARKQDDGQWETPKNIGYPINTEADEASFFVSTDGRTAYVASNNIKTGPGGWDLYSFELYPEARPERVLFVSGEVTQEDNNEPVEATVELRNVETRRVTQIPVDNETGRYVAAVRFDADYVLTVKKENHAYESTYIAQEDTSYIAPSQIDFEVKPIEKGRSYTIKDINFDTDKYTLNKQAKFIIEDFAEFLKDHTHIRAEVQGHTDNVGGADYNRELSNNRAKSVYNYLLDLGIPASRLSYKGYGLTKPIASNATEKGRAQNRRTEFFIIP